MLDSWSWELLVRSSINYFGDSVPGPSKATAKNKGAPGVLAARKVEFVLWGSGGPETRCFSKNYSSPWKAPAFLLEIFIYKISVLIFLSLIFRHRTCNNNFKNIYFADLIQCTNEMNVNIPQLADSLFERTTNSSWVVVFKSLITTHHLMVYGNEVIQKTIFFWGQLEEFIPISAKFFQ